MVRVLIAAITVPLLACGSGGSGPSAAPDGEIDRDEVVAGVDLSKRTVPLEDVHFDTFDGGSVSLAEADEDQVLSLLDAIPPIDEPVYDDAETAGEWLADDAAILGYVTPRGAAYAYPHQILNFHEIVNDTFDDVPVLISYCPLCRSGVIYDRTVGDAPGDDVLSFGNSSALYDSDLVMVDRQTSTYWWQVPGRAIVGTLSGRELTALASSTTTWSDWVDLHPDTQVLSRDLGFGRDYDRDPFFGYADRVDGGQIRFPVNPSALEDTRLSPAEVVVGVDIGGAARAYPIEDLAGQVLNETVGGQRIVVLVDRYGASAGVFDPTVGGRELTFGVDGGEFVDTQTDSTWDIAGRAIGGPLVGATLTGVPSRSTFWFAYVASFPDAVVAGAA